MSWQAQISTILMGSLVIAGGVLFFLFLRPPPRLEHPVARPSETARVSFAAKNIPPLALTRSTHKTPHAPQNEFALTGTVVDTTTDDPVSNAHVSLYQEQQGVWNRWESVKTGKAGGFRFDGLLQGRYRLLAQANGYLMNREETVHIGSDNISTLVVKLEPGNAISGCVLDDTGGPIVGARVQLVVSRLDVGIGFDQLYGSTPQLVSVTDAEGCYHLEGFPSYGQYAILAVHANYASATLGPIEVGENESLADIDIVLPLGGAIRGCVFDAMGRALPQVAVKAISQPPVASSKGEGEDLWAFDQALVVDTTTDGEGAYAFEHLAAASYVIQAITPDGQTANTEPVDVFDRQAIEAIDVVFEEGSILAGRIIDSTGRAVPGAQVSIEGTGRAPSWTDDEGFFEIEGLLEAEYMLTIDKGGFGRQSRYVTVPEYDVVIELGPIEGNGG